MEWQPIETAPREGWILVCEYTGPGFYCIRPAAWVINYWHSVGEQIEPTHWMPLPEPPK